MGRPKKGEPERCTCCGKEIYRPPSQRKRGRPFCSRQCHMRLLNAELNPTRMTTEVKEKLRAARLNSGAGKSYRKLRARHEHRVVAELMLGRPLRPGEVVHHKDGDIRNNSPDNLTVFTSQAEHARHHMRTRGGDGNEVQPERTPEDLGSVPAEE